MLRQMFAQATIQQIQIGRFIAARFRSIEDDRDQRCRLIYPIAYLFFQINPNLLALEKGNSNSFISVHTQAIFRSSTFDNCDTSFVIKNKRFRIIRVFL